MGIIKFAVKSSVAGGLVYWTVQEGLWGRSDESINFYNRIYSTVSPYIKKNIPKEVVNEVNFLLKKLPDLPSVNSMANWTGCMWNRGVKTSIRFIADLPDHISNGIESIKSMPALQAPADSSSAEKSSATVKKDEKK
ncbi:Similar to QIL1: MICOS complex subunit MIC13 homolog QIL1 (Drosophila melanogaster) [Cotesia congregata]|uniref:MICOS complex subunit MIC13 n=1 Tax=Cotesia congregata TaxID=51543 RepID=A0A8J2HQ99_COTCN|nr:Similar to QIL1: MICOS complex subunit MIC13 homolog QIL1 (Drosophila melanogaster) [Cotesia congregata]